MNLSGVTDVVCQADEAMTCPTSDLQHPLAAGDAERPHTVVTDVCSLESAMRSYARLIRS